MSRRSALTQLAALPLMMAAGAASAAETKLPLKIMMKSAWGSDADLAQWGAKFGNPTIFVSLVEWADRIITE
ncbi:MAG TPA: hypothetical protein VGO37_04035 [Steroidobacteraceae bacterium]|nr:hypothetical protein [Steroidobacteraceae bacterium]